MLPPSRVGAVRRAGPGRAGRRGSAASCSRRGLSEPGSGNRHRPGTPQRHRAQVPLCHLGHPDQVPRAPPARPHGVRAFRGLCAGTAPCGREAGRRRQYERFLAQAGLLRCREATAEEEEETD